MVTVFKSMLLDSHKHHSFLEKFHFSKMRLYAFNSNPTNLSPYNTIWQKNDYMSIKLTTLGCIYK